MNMKLNAVLIAITTLGYMYYLLKINQPIPAIILFIVGFIGLMACCIADLQNIKGDDVK